MADGVGITTGSDATVATDDAGAAGQVQIVKLALSADGSATVIGADANGLDVDPTRLPGTVADGGALPAVVFVMGGYDGANAQVLKTDSSGVLQADVLTLPEGITVSDAEAHALLAAIEEALDGTLAVADSTAASTLGAIKALLEGTLKVSGSVTVTGEPTVKATDGGGSLTVDSLALGGTEDAEASGNGSIIAILKRLRKLLGEVVVTKVEGALPAGSSTIGKVGLAPQSSGGLSLYRSLDLDETEEQVKGTAGQLYGYYLYNGGESAVYVKIYNATEASVTVGTTTPVLTIPIPAKSAANVEFTNGIAFSTAITAAATTGVADNDTGAPAANQVVANFFYV